MKRVCYWSISRVEIGSDAREKKIKIPTLRSFHCMNKDNMVKKNKKNKQSEWNKRGSIEAGGVKHKQANTAKEDIRIKSTFLIQTTRDQITRKRSRRLFLTKPSAPTRLLPDTRNIISSSQWLKDALVLHHAAPRWLLRDGARRTCSTLGMASNHRNERYTLKPWDWHIQKGDGLTKIFYTVRILDPIADRRVH